MAQGVEDLAAAPVARRRTTSLWIAAPEDAALTNIGARPVARSMGPPGRVLAGPEGWASARSRATLGTAIDCGLLWHANGPMEFRSSAWYKIAASSKGRLGGRAAAEQPDAADEAGAMAGAWRRLRS